MEFGNKEKKKRRNMGDGEKHVTESTDKDSKKRKIFSNEVVKDHKRKKKEHKDNSEALSEEKYVNKYAKRRENKKARTKTMQEYKKTVHEDNEHRLTEMLNQAKGESSEKGTKNVYKMENLEGDPDNIDEELDPEKAAIRKKKREKRREKKLQKLEARQRQRDRAGTAKPLAIEYLKQWHIDRDNWKFQKVRQVWLLHNMFNESLISDEAFEVLLSYIEPLKGRSKDETIKAAEKIVQDVEADENSHVWLLKTGRQKSTLKDAVKEERAKRVIQLLY